MRRLFLILVINVITACSINWLSLHRGGHERWGHSRSCRNARRVYGFTRGQTRTCRGQVEVMPHVAHAADTTVNVCQRIFHTRRWNCSSLLNAPALTPDLTEGTREQAVVHALSSAAVTWAVARACSLGTLVLCGCGRVPQEPPNGHFKWGGCGDNVRFGAAFAKHFIDAKDGTRRKVSKERERRAARRRQGRRQDEEEEEEDEEEEEEEEEEEPDEAYEEEEGKEEGDGWSNSPRHNREVEPFSLHSTTERNVQHKNTRRRSRSRRREGEQRTKAPRRRTRVGGSRRRRKKKGWRRKKKGRRKQQDPAVTIMNQHNNRVGRRVVKSSLSTQCKCHGVSGSCNIKTCWKALPSFTQAGERLYRRYLSGVEVRAVSAGPRLRLLPASPAVSRFSRDDLIYVKKSPDYCHPEPSVGSVGTRGRRCNASSEGVDGCGVMCCGRGFTSHTRRTHHRCHCKYHWCCYVTCQTCAVWHDVHTCN